MYNNCKYFIVNPQVLRCRYALADEYIGHGVEFTFLRASWYISYLKMKFLLCKSESNSSFNKLSLVNNKFHFKWKFVVMTWCLRILTHESCPAWPQYHSQFYIFLNKEKSVRLKCGITGFDPRSRVGKQVVTAPLPNARQQVWVSWVLEDGQFKGLAHVTVGVAR